MTKLKLLSLLALVATLPLVGCASGPKMIRELKGDPAIVNMSIQSVYGTVKFTRVGVQTNNAVAITADGTVTITPKP